MLKQGVQHSFVVSEFFSLMKSIVCQVGTAGHPCCTAMSVITARTLFTRAGAAMDCTGLPWRHLQCWYSTKQRKAMSIIRWNAENKMLFGAKRNTTRKKASAKGSAKETGKGSQTERGMKMKGAQERQTGNKEVGLNMWPASEAAVFDDLPETNESSEWWQEKSVWTEEKKSDMFQEENALYNRLLDNGKAYEGSEESAASWASHSANRVDIPKLPPIPKGRDTPHGAGKASSLQHSDSKKLSKVSSTASDSNFTGVDFIQRCPLFPTQFEEVRSSAEEFHGFVDSLNLRLLPTVNTVLNKTRTELSNFFLQRWREKMIQELGELGFKKHQEAIIWQGTNLHACVQHYLSGVPLADVQVQENIRGHWDSISSVLPEVTEVQAVETDVSHPWLCYRGTFDCIAKYKKTLYVIDWKTSTKPKPLLSNLYDNPLQVAAYLGAVNLTPDLTDRFGVIEQAAIIVAYANGEAAHVHRIQPALCQHYWKEWCQRLQQYWSAVATEKGT